MRARFALLALALPFELVVASAAAQDAQPPVVREEVEIREVGVVADLDRSLRGLSAAELAQRVIVLEDGVARAPMSVAALDSPGRAIYSRVVVAFDSTHCDDSILRAGAAAVGAEAERLVRLGPVEVVRAGERSETLLERAKSADAVAKVAADVSRADRCRATKMPAGAVPPGLSPGSCEGGPCLLVWIGAGWGDDPAAVEAEAPALEKSVHDLAVDGWVVLAAPIARSEREKSGPTLAPPDHQPGTDRYSFGISVFGRKKAEKLTPEEFNRYVDLWLTPLRRLAAATAGELATDGPELVAALDALARRSILWYRAERQVGAPVPRLEVREAEGAGRRLRTPEWAPALH